MKAARYLSINLQSGSTGGLCGENGGACRAGRGAPCHSVLIQSWITFAAR
jgi:hypothetical protein